ncbi:MAG TPA: KUP/HAK/KT family potassium transporter [Acidimicrobiia bacterium]|nr:KUP/HAK/KT family potassium transporter [Acidimicrobiia bacterium]
MKSGQKKTLPLALGALGVVFGDIGTSPLYSVNEIFEKTHALGHERNAVIGGISLVFWALTIAICCKYIIFVLRADKQGEGGVFTLFAILREHRNRVTLAMMGLLVISAGFLLGEGIITPAISVLAAVEGVEVVSSSFSRFVIPLTLIILSALFLAQRKGTHKVGRLFGPITLTWFVAIGGIGLFHVLRNPEIVYALNPVNIRHIFDHFSFHGILLLMGSVILVITGGEALYADLGHFGKKPIRLSWVAIVYPALVLNYLGQGAFLLSGEQVQNENLFFSTVPQVLLIPMVILATCATVIASQALITGAFSLASQGMALSLIPKMRVVHTHREHEGQVYIPFVNWSIFIGCVFLVLAFRSSGNLAAAYGLAVSAVMLNTSLAVCLVAIHTWKWRKMVAIPLFTFFAIIDALFLLSNLVKIPSGGYVPIITGAVLATIMFTWNWGRRKVRVAIENIDTSTMAEFLESKNSESQHFPRSMIMLTPEHPTELNSGTPTIAALFKRRYDYLPRHLILLTIRQKRRPHVAPEERYEIIEFDNDHDNDRSLLSIQANFGFMEDADVEEIVTYLAENKALSAHEDPKQWLIHATKERVVIKTKAHGLEKFRYGLFRSLSRQAQPAYYYFGLDNDTRLSLELISVEL